jgi:glutamate 5-kinase
VLLTLDNLSSRKQYVRARNTFNALFDMGCVPIVNGTAPQLEIICVERACK